MPSSASSFKFPYVLFPLKSFGSSLRLLSRLPVPSILPSITRYRASIYITHTIYLLSKTVIQHRWLFLLCCLCVYDCHLCCICFLCVFYNWLLQGRHETCGHIGQLTIRRPLSRYSLHFLGLVQTWRDFLKSCAQTANNFRIIFFSRVKT